MKQIKKFFLEDESPTLNRSKSLEPYDKIMQDQIGEGIVEKVTESEKSVHDQKSEKVFYLPHRPVNCDFVESAKLRIVYDPSTKANKSGISLSKCFEIGPPRQNSLYDILVRSRIRPIILCGYIQKAFWQIRIRKYERNSIELFSKGWFNLQKWHSNIPSLENGNANSEQTYTKQLFSSNSSHAKIVSLGWNKITETVNIEIPRFMERQITKRNVLIYIGSIYDLLGLISAVHIIGKIYSELCRSKNFLG